MPAKLSSAVVSKYGNIKKKMQPAIVIKTCAHVRVFENKIFFVNKYSNQNIKITMDSTHIKQVNEDT